MGHQTPFASTGAINYLFNRRAGQGKAASVGVGHTKFLKRQSAKIHRRLGKFLIHEACALDLETGDDAPIQFTFASPAYYCPECGARYEDSRDMEDCTEKHEKLRETVQRYEGYYFDWVEKYERDCALEFDDLE